MLNDFPHFHFVDHLLQTGSDVYVVGGAVRDALLQKTIKDLDLVVCKTPFAELVEKLKPFGYVNLVGKSFGIIKFRPKEFPDNEIDIALPRTEVSTGSGHRDFDVRFDHNLPLAQDLARRDFTINAMAYDVRRQNLVDPFRGQDDLQNKTIRTVFDNSFVEDPLRLLRAVQFAARLGFALAPETEAQLKAHAALIETVAKERIIDEIRKLFLADKPSQGFDLMRDTGLLPFVFPDVQQMIGVTQPNKNNEDVYTHTMKVLDAARSAEELEKPGDINLMFSALFHDAGKPKTRAEKPESGRVTFYNHQHISTGIAWRWMKDFRATTIGVNPKHVCHLVKHHMFETKEFDNDRALRRFINKVGKENVFDLLDLRLADKKGGKFPKKVYGILQLRQKIRAEVTKKTPFGSKDLALNGQDLIQMGFGEGPIIGVIQKFLVETVLDEPELNTVEKLTEIVQTRREEFLKEAQTPKRKKPKEASDV